MANITFRFDKEVLQAGEQLTGDIIIEVTKPIDFCAVEFYIIGEEGVHIHEKRTTFSNGKTTTKYHTHYYHSKLFEYKEFLSLKPGTPGYEEEEVTNNQQKKKTAKLQVGTYILPFSVLIASSLPPSLELTPGTCRAYVQYFATANVNTNNMFTDFWKNLNIKRFNFKVIDNYNEENYHRNSYPQQKHSEKSFLFRSGKLKFTASIPRSSYFPGEIVPITLHITNETSKHIDDIRVGMTRVVQQKPRMFGMESISAHIINSCSTKKQVNEKSTVPAMTIEYQLSSEKPWGPSLSLKNFELSYMINVVLVPNGLACNLSLEFPIVIVTPPLKLQSNSLISISPYTSPAALMMTSFSFSSSSSSSSHQPPVEYDHIVNEDGFVEIINNTSDLSSNNEDEQQNNNNNNNNIQPPYAVCSPLYVPFQFTHQYAPHVLQFTVEMNQKNFQYSHYHSQDVQLNYPIMDHFSP